MGNTLFLSNKGGFITEEYVCYIAYDNYLDEKDANERNANEYIYEFIRTGKVGIGYYLNDDVVKDILSDCDEIDMLSDGMYNFYIFDFLLNHDHDNDLSRKLDFLLDHISNDKTVFWDFYKSYCLMYMERLISASHDYYENNNLDEYLKLPIVKLTKKILKGRAVKIARMIIESDLNNNAKNFLLSFVILDRDILMGNNINGSMKDYLRDSSEFLLSNFEERKLIAQFYLNNSVAIANLKSLGLDNEMISKNIEIIKIVLNRDNIKYLDANNIWNI